jgi:hypothetical protein
MKILSFFGGGKEVPNEIKTILIEPTYEEKWLHFSDISPEEYEDNSYYRALFQPRVEIERIQQLTDKPIYNLLHILWFEIQFYDWVIENELGDVIYANATYNQINRWSEWASA